MQKDDQRERMSKASKDMPDHTRDEDKSQMRDKDQSCPTKGGTVRESETKPSDTLAEVESLEEYDDRPQLTCFIPQCRNWRSINVSSPYLDPGRCALKHAFIRQKTFTICSDRDVRYTAQWPEFECQGFEWHDQYDRQNATWAAVAEVCRWPDGPSIDQEAIDHLARIFEMSRRQPLEDPTVETTEEVSEVIPKEEPASNVIEFPADLSRR